MSSRSGSRRPPRQPPRPELTPEERSLWRHVARSVDPTRQGKPRVPDVEPATDLDAPVTARRFPHSAREARQRPEPPRRPPSAAPAPGPRTPRAPQSLPPVERRHARRIASGAVEIEARLDLHGLTQSEAHHRLISFLRHCAAAGLKTVLVITGKGASRPGPPTERNRRADEDVGVLRRSVPRWLAEAPLAPLVIGCQSASPRHGGDGAVYVLLRRSRRPGAK